MLEKLWIFASIGPRWGAAGDRPHQELGHDVHDHSDEEERESDFDQCAEIQIASASLNSFAITLAMVYPERTGFGDLGTIADHHGDGHGFAERAA